MRSQPLGMVRPDDHHHPTSGADAFHLGEPAVAAVGRLGRERGTGDDQFGRSVRKGKGIEESADDPGVCHRCQPGTQPFSQRSGRLDGGQLVATGDQLDGEPPGSRAHLDDAGHVRREPFEDAGMKGLGGNQPLVELGLEPVEELPG